MELKSLVWGCPNCILWGGVQKDFGHNLLSWGWMWLTSFMGQPLFPMDLTCVCFVSRDFLFLKGGSQYQQQFLYPPPPPPPPVCLSICPSVCLSVNLSCPPCSIYSSRWILSIFSTNDQWHERVCRMWWPLTLTYIFKVIRPWLTYLLSCVVCCIFFLQNLEIWIFGKFWKFFGLDLEKKTTVLNAFFPYLAQMITSMRGCVAYNDLWPWPISSRSFGLGLENHVRSVASTVLDGFFPYLVQMITSMRRCVACDNLWPWPISSWSFDLDFENRVRSVTFSVLDWLFPYLPQIITTIRWWVACWVYNKILKFQFFTIFFNWNERDLMWNDSMSNHGVAGDILRMQAF